VTRRVCRHIDRCPAKTGGEKRYPRRASCSSRPTPAAATALDHTFGKTERRHLADKARSGHSRLPLWARHQLDRQQHQSRCVGPVPRATFASRSVSWSRGKRHYLSKRARLYKIAAVSCMHCCHSECQTSVQSLIPSVPRGSILYKIATPSISLSARSRSSGRDDPTSPRAWVGTPIVPCGQPRPGA
jgi:hypothetical protein